MAAGRHAPHDPETPNDPSRPPAQQPVPVPAPPRHVVRRTRISGTWAASACFAVILLLLLIFILQNGRGVEVSYFGAHGHLPLGVALLLSAVSGVLLVAVPGTARIIQLRRTASRHRHTDAQGPATLPAQPRPAVPTEQPPDSGTRPSP